MRSSHHNRGKGVCVLKGEVTYHGEKRLVVGTGVAMTQNLPPASGRQPFGVHLAHVAHADQANDEILHPLGDGLYL